MWEAITVIKAIKVMKHLDGNEKKTNVIGTSVENRLML
jgi:hypothetical protein